MKYLSLFFAFVLFLPCTFAQQNVFASKNEKLLDIANRIEGKWQIEDIGYVNDLTGPKHDKSDFIPIEFKLNPAVLDSFILNFEQADVNIDVKKLDIYAAGELFFGEARALFVLAEDEEEAFIFNFIYGQGAGPGMEMKISMDIHKYAGDDTCLLIQGHTQYKLKRSGLNHEFLTKNIVANHLEGNWIFNQKLSNILNPEARQMTTVQFKVDNSIVYQIPAKYYSFLSKNNIYLAGKMTLEKNEFPFVLTTLDGNPHVFFFEELNGDPFGDAESFNLSIAVGGDKSKDLLFIGGDFSDEPFVVFQRKD